MKAAAGVALALALLGWGRSRAPFAPRFQGDEAEVVDYISHGEALIHGIQQPSVDFSHHMPLPNILAAALFNHSGPTARKGWFALAAGALVLLVFALGGLLGGVCAGAVAAAGLLLLGAATPPISSSSSTPFMSCSWRFF